jgi:hypothetical protein
MLGIAGAVLLGLMWGVRQYGNARVATGDLVAVTQAVQGAVVEREVAVKVDVRQAKENRTSRDAVRSAVIRARKQNEEIPKLGLDAVGDAERIRVLNVAIDKANEVVASTGILPERL